jgi:hypothetical protein
MKKHFLVLALLITAGSTSLLFSQTTETIFAKDAAGNPMLLAEQPRSALLLEPFRNWYQSNYDNYVVDSFTCSFIRPLLADKQLTNFLGTWCGDSKREVPRILKMLDCCGFPADQLQLVMLSNHADMYKKSPDGEEQGRNIIRVPTLIIEANGKEVGRIVENPFASLEKDLLAILRHEKYTPRYHTSSAR